MRLIPIAADGWRFILPFGVAGALLLGVGRVWGTSLGVLSLGLAVFCLFFFRDFDRKTVIDPSLIYSPGDGVILGVESTDKEKGGTQIVRIFLSVLNGHVQRFPVSGRIEKIDYKKGTFLDARDPRAHIDNEQNAVTIKAERGNLVVKQIAGLIARRIVCWAKEGEAAVQGQRYGLIRFGSQVDVLLPANANIQVKVGDKVVGGETVLALWKS